MQTGYSQRVMAISSSFLMKDTNYHELLNINGCKLDTVKEPKLCHVPSSLKIGTPVSY